MADTEKITIDLDIVDLGNIDFLIEDGSYSDRREFINTAVKNLLEKHNLEIKDTIVKRTYSAGVVSFNRESLENELKQNNMLEIKVIGMLVLQDNIPDELALKTIKSIKVFGTFKASERLKEVLKDRILR